MLRFFENIPEIVAVMSERKDGSMKLFKDSDLNLRNRAIFFGGVGIDKNKVIAAEVIHGANVAIVDSASSEMISGVDGLVTKDRNVFLSVTVADCVPVYFYEAEHKIIAIAHCGWRGIIDGVIENSLDKIFYLGGMPEGIKVAMGPGINRCHFEIGEDVLDRFSSYNELIIKSKGKIFVDLKGIIKKQLANFNIKSENIENNNECTMENERYFSFRRDRPRLIEAMVAVIGIEST